MKRSLAAIAALLVLVMTVTALVSACGTTASPTATTAPAVATDTTAPVAEPTTPAAAPTAAPTVEPTTAATTAPTAAPTTAAAETPSGGASNTTLAVKGLVTTPLTLTLADLQAMNVTTVNAELKGTASDYTGVKLNDILDKAGPKPEAQTVVLTGADGFQGEVALADVKACQDCLVGFQAAGGFQMVMPGQSNKAWVRDVVSIELK
jgi:DMSO/TMAO reductase YedYZ molybdopterin-dependent catalytic subunit